MGKIAGAKIGTLRLGCDAPRTGRQVDRDACRIIRHVIGVGAPAIPNGEEHLVGAWRALTNAVNEHLASGRTPCIGCTAVVRRIVRSI